MAQRCSMLLALALLTACGQSPPTVVDGVIDLRNWNFDDDGPVDLAGSWEFSFGHLLVDEGDAMRPTVDHLQAPGNWRGAPTQQGRATAVGFGTLRARLLLPALPLAVSLTCADTAYTLDVIDNTATATRQRLMSSGVVARDADHGVADSIPDSAPLPLSTSLTLVHQISNFSYPWGGPRDSIRLGRPAQLARERDADRSEDFFVVGVLVMVGLYHLALFALRRSERAPMWFALLCFTTALRTLERGYHIQELYPGSHLWPLLKRIEFITPEMMTPLFCVFIYGAIPGLISKRFVLAVALPCAVFVLLGITTSTLVFTRAAPPYQVITLATAGWILYRLMSFSRHRGTWEVRVMLFGMIILLVGIINDILVVYFILHTPFVGGYVLVGFALAQAIVLAIGAARSRRAAEDLAVRLLRLDGLKNEFLARTSHELRTPLSAIINIPRGLLAEIEERPVLVCPHCQAVVDVDAEHDPSMRCGDCERLGLIATQRRFAPDDADGLAAQLHHIIAAGHGLLGLVNDILDHSKLAAGRFQVTRAPVALDDVVAAALQNVTAALQIAGAEVTPKLMPGLQVDGDRGALVQVMTNLIEHAVGASSRGGVVDVVVAREGAFVVVSVADHGAGIAPEEQATIFDSFRHVEGKGSGLGLAIVRQLVELHGGTVSVRSGLGAGATFEVRLALLSY